MILLLFLLSSYFIYSAVRSGEVYKPTSKLAERVEEQKRIRELTAAVTSEPLQSVSSKPSLKKQTGEKKLSNLELFKEELRVYAVKHNEYIIPRTYRQFNALFSKSFIIRIKASTRARAATPDPLYSP